MFHALLQLWGGFFYLLNKIFLWRAERDHAVVREDGYDRVLAWSVYLIGLPAWVWIFVTEHNWIAAGVELGGAPSMLLGLIIALRGKGKEPKWLNAVAIIAVLPGFAYSMYDFDGFRRFTQVLETLMVAGFLSGTYLLAKKERQGYFGFMAMNASNAALMAAQNYTWLFLQQIVSLLFVVDAYRHARMRS